MCEFREKRVRGIYDRVGVRARPQDWLEVKGRARESAEYQQEGVSGKEGVKRQDGEIKMESNLFIGGLKKRVLRCEYV